MEPASPSHADEGEAACAGEAKDAEGLAWLQERLSELEEQLMLARRDRGDAELRSSRLSEQLDHLWQDLDNEKRERQVQANEERLLRIAEVAELRDAVQRLNKATRLDPDLEGPPDFSVLATCLEEDVEDRREPELTADLDAQAAARNVEAQLKRVVADARRAEASVRRELARAMADTRAYLEDTGQQQQELWAARQRMAASAAVPALPAKAAKSEELTLECLVVRLESLDLQMRARLEKAERGYATVQSCVDRLSEMPAHLESLFTTDLDNLRQEVLEALQHERDHAHGAGQVLARTLSSEIARSVADQAIAEVRAEIVANIAAEAKLLREEFARSRSDEAYRQTLRIHGAEERISALERRNVGTTPASLSEETLVAIEDTLHEWRKENVQVHTEVKCQAQKLKQDFDDLKRQLADRSAADIADLHQRFDHLEEKLRSFVPAVGEGQSAEDAISSVRRLTEVLEETEVMKKCVAELMQRFADGRLSECASQGCTPQVPLEPTHLQTTPTTTVAASPPLSYTTGATGSWVAPAQAVTKGSDVPVSIKQVRPREGSHVPPRVVAKPQIASPPTHFRTVVQRSVSVPVLQPVDGLTVAHPSMPVPAQMHVQIPLGTQSATHATAASSGSLRLQPAVVRTASPPQGSMPVAQSRHKPADSPYLRHRPVKVAPGSPLATASLPPGRPLAKR